MLGIEHYWLFLLSGVILNITPGPDTIYIVTRSIAQGRNAGIMSVLGISTGGLIHTLLASLGLSVILASSQTAFNIVRYTGGLYLIYLGISVFLRCKEQSSAGECEYHNMKLPTIYLQGILTNVLNPKVALFFLSFLPQFINPAKAAGPIPFLLLGGTFFTTGTIWCLFLACAASYLTNALRKNSKISKILQCISGIIFIALGLSLALRR
jgi:RhtB (resistance to homoserine/threonine) family protein